VQPSARDEPHRFDGGMPAAWMLIFTDGCRSGLGVKASWYRAPIRKNRALIFFFQLNGSHALFFKSLQGGLHVKEKRLLLVSRTFFERAAPGSMGLRKALIFGERLAELPNLVGYPMKHLTN